MFEVSTSVSNTRAETFTPLVDGVVDKALLYISPHVNQTSLQIVQILDLCLVNFVPHNAPDLVVDRIKVGGHRSGEMNAGVSRSGRLMVLRALCALPGHCPAEK